MEKLTEWNRHADIFEEKKSKSNHIKRNLTMPTPNMTGKSKRLRAQSDSIDVIGSASNFLGGVSYIPVSVCFPPNDVVHRIKAHDLGG